MSERVKCRICRDADAEHIDHCTVGSAYDDPDWPCCGGPDCCDLSNTRLWERVELPHPEVERLKAELAAAREELTRIDYLNRSTLMWAGQWPPSPGGALASSIGVVAKLEGRPYADVAKHEESCHAATEAIRAGKAIS